MRRFVNLPPGARSRRCDSHDYRGGAYFVTTNTRKQVPLFGSVEHGRMYLNRYGKIVAEEWRRTEKLRDEVWLDEFIVMPDHFHATLWIADRDDKTPSESLEDPQADCQGSREVHLATTSKLPPGLEERQAGTLSTIVGCFKAAVTRQINNLGNSKRESVWQSGFRDRIIRDSDELNRIRRYIRTNPQEWSRSD